MKHLRVLHLDSGPTWRGGQRQVLLLAKGQRARGHEPVVVAPRHSPLLKRARDAGLAVTAVALRAEYDVLSARRLRARISAWRPHIVHAHDARTHAIALIALVGVPRVQLVVSRRVAFIPKSARLKYGPRVSAFIAVSDAVRRAMVSAGIEPHRIHVVHSGIELPKGRVEPRDWRSELHWPRDTVIAGIVGSMTAEKGLSDLPAIAAGMPAESRDRIGVLLIGGSRAERVTTRSAAFRRSWRTEYPDCLCLPEMCVRSLKPRRVLHPASSCEMRWVQRRAAERRDSVLTR